MAESQKNRRIDHWHFEKSISLSHIISTITLVMVLAAGWMSVTERILVLETQYAEFNGRIVRMLEAQEARDDRQDGDFLELRRESSENYRQILDQLRGTGR